MGSTPSTRIALIAQLVGGACFKSRTVKVRVLLGAAKERGGPRKGALEDLNYSTTAYWRR